MPKRSLSFVQVWVCRPSSCYPFFHLVRRKNSWPKQTYVRDLRVLNNFIFKCFSCVIRECAQTFRLVCTWRHSSTFADVEFTPRSALSNHSPYFTVFFILGHSRYHQKWLFFLSSSSTDLLTRQITRIIFVTLPLFFRVLLCISVFHRGGGCFFLSLTFEGW